MPPEIDGKVFMDFSEGVREGDLLKVKITDYDSYDLIAERLTE